MALRARYKARMVLTLLFALAYLAFWIFTFQFRIGVFKTRDFWSVFVFVGQVTLSLSFVAMSARKLWRKSRVEADTKSARDRRDIADPKDPKGSRK